MAQQWAQLILSGVTGRTQEQMVDFKTRSADYTFILCNVFLFYRIVPSTPR